MMWPIEPWPPEPNGTDLVLAFDPLDQLRHGLGRHGRTHHEGVGDRADIGHVHEVLQRIVGRLVEQEGRDRQRRAVRQHQRVVVLGLQARHWRRSSCRRPACCRPPRSGRAFPTAGPEITRAAASDAPPGGKVTTIFTGRVGHCWAARCRRRPAPSRMPRPVCVRSWNPPGVASRHAIAMPASGATAEK